VASALRKVQPEGHGGRNPLIAKLETLAELPEPDRLDLEAICTEARPLSARRHVIREGERPSDVHLVVDGWAARYKMLDDGSRQITAFLIPGDFCDIHVGVLGEMDHNIVTLTKARIAFVPRRRMEELAERPVLGKAF
jgi:CRP-like cAMP-binding protein